MLIAGIVVAHQLPPHRAELLAHRQVAGLVAAVGRHAADVLGPAAGLRQHRQHVAQRLLELRRQFLALEDLLRVPAHLSGDEHDARAGGRDDAVGVADRAFQPSAAGSAGSAGCLAASVDVARRIRIDRPVAVGLRHLASHSRTSATCSASSWRISSAALRTASVAAVPASSAKKASARCSAESASCSACQGCIR